MTSIMIVNAKPVSAKQMEAILMLPPPKRYSHFIKRVVSLGGIWGLYDEGWAMSEAPDGSPVLPLWPAKEYAERCIGGEWSAYKPRAIELDDVLENLIPSLRERGVSPGVFFDVNQGSINATIDELERDLRTELQKYVYL
jgi:hypothetical protein